MHPYTWKLAIEGIHAQAEFVLKYGFGLGKIRQESMEGWIGLIKNYLRRSGNYRDGWLLRTVYYLDLFCNGSVECNLVDFLKIAKKHFMMVKLVHRGAETNLKQYKIENSLPERAQYILCLIDSIQFKGPIHPMLQQIFFDMTDEQMERLEVMDDSIDNSIVYEIVSNMDIYDSSNEIEHEPENETENENENETENENQNQNQNRAQPYSRQRTRRQTFDQLQRESRQLARQQRRFS